MYRSVNPPVLPLDFRRDDKARANFLSGFRQHVFEKLAGVMRRDYRDSIEGTVAADPEAIHERMRERESFRFYSALRVASQDMLYQVVRAPVERSRSITAPAQEASRRPRKQSVGKQSIRRRSAKVALHLDPELPIPRSVSAVDVHLMPGSYSAEYAADDVAMGAVYDARLRISTFGLFGPDLDDIGQSMARALRARLPEFSPRRILDLGCTVGHNTLPWKSVFPQAELYGIDVAAPCLRYAQRRAESLGVPVGFWQMNATSLRFPDEYFDVVFSSMFLHEVPRKDIASVLREAQRVLRPGGVMLHMELPPSSSVEAYESFYLDWDGRYNNEPFYRPFRSMDLSAAAVKAGFPSDSFFEWVVPSWHGGGKVDAGNVGRLASGVSWYAFGARKR